MSEARAIMHFESMKKSTATAYLLWWFLGIFGAHRFYLGKTGSAIAMLLITLFSFLSMIVFIGFFTIFITMIWWFVDLFLIPEMTRSYNVGLANMLAPRG